MGAAVIPYAFAGRIGIDFGILDLLIFDFVLDYGNLEGLDMAFSALSISLPAYWGVWRFVQFGSLGFFKLSLDGLRSFLDPTSHGSSSLRLD